jgi:membrane-bound inhibitor of C-type lysozyme
MLALAALAALGAGCKASSGSPALKISGGDPVLYDCGGGARITARYYSLSDGSLSFVKLEMPDGAKFTLPNLASASGARYSDDMNLVWWTKGNGAFAEKRDDSGQWKTIYPDCREIEKGAK